MTDKAKNTETTQNNPPTSGHNQPYMLKPEVAALVRKTERTVEAWMRDGIIPYLKIGKGRRATVLFRRADIESHLSSRFGVGIHS